MSEDELLIKICLLGSSFELNNAFCATFLGFPLSDSWISTSRTLGALILRSERIDVDQISIGLIIFHILQDFDRKINLSYLRGSSAIIITFDKRDQQSFNEAERIYKEHSSLIQQNAKAIVGFIVHSPLKRATKTNLKEVYVPTFLKIEKSKPVFDVENENYEEITFEEGLNLAEAIGASYYETEPNDKRTINKIFLNLIQQVLRIDKEH